MHHAQSYRILQRDFLKTKQERVIQFLLKKETIHRGGQPPLIDPGRDEIYEKTQNQPNLKLRKPPGLDKSPLV